MPAFYFRIYLVWGRGNPARVASVVLQHQVMHRNHSRIGDQSAPIDPTGQDCQNGKEGTLHF